MPLPVDYRFLADRLAAHCSFNNRCDLPCTTASSTLELFMTANRGALSCAPGDVDSEGEGA